MLCLIPIAQDVPHTCSSFELLGFDILLDDTLRPHILEINMSPSLNTDSHIDVMVKKPMVRDLVSLVMDPDIRQETNAYYAVLRDIVPTYRKKWISSGKRDLKARNRRPIIKGDVGNFGLLYPRSDSGCLKQPDGLRKAIMKVKKW